MGGRERRCSHKNYVIIGMMKVLRQYKKFLPYRQNFFNAKGGVICEADHEMEENADSIVWHERKNFYRGVSRKILRLMLHCFLYRRPLLIIFYRLG